MRDAISGVVTIQFILVFIAVISGYLAFSVSYTKAVHVKDFIINKIEEYEAPPSDSRVKKAIDEYIGQVGYHGVPDANNDASSLCSELEPGEIVQGGGSSYDSESSTTDYVICKFAGADKESSGTETEQIKRSYYGVVTYITIDVPIINNIMANLKFFKISGKTRLIEDNR